MQIKVLPIPVAEPKVAHVFQQVQTARERGPCVSHLKKFARHQDGSEGHSHQKAMEKGI